MDDMNTRHARAAQVLQNRIVKALAGNEPITPDMLRTWVQAVRIERESSGHPAAEPDLDRDQTIEDALFAAASSGNLQAIAVWQERQERKALLAKLLGKPIDDR